MPNGPARIRNFEPALAGKHSKREKLSAIKFGKFKVFGMFPLPLIFFLGAY